MDSLLHKVSINSLVSRAFTFGVLAARNYPRGAEIKWRPRRHPPPRLAIAELGPARRVAPTQVAGSSPKVPDVTATVAARLSQNAPQ